MRCRHACALAVALVLLAPSTMLATPAPTSEPRPTETSRPERMEAPTDAPATPQAPVPVPVPPDRTSLIVGYREPGILGQLPFIVAQLSGYFTDVGFSSGVTIVEVPDPLRDVSEGSLDIAVVPSRSAWELYDNDPSVPAVAGFRNYDREGGAYGGDLLVARPGLVEDEPATLIAFLSAYTRALQDLADPGSASETLALIQGSVYGVPPDLAADWQTQVARFAPFDGGFGSVEETDGYGELAAWLAQGGEEPDLDGFVADHTLNVAQAQQGIGPNPDAGLAGAPSLADISVGLPLADSATSPILVAQAQGYFEAAGFASVEVVDVEEPLLGLLTGELDFAVTDVTDAMDAVNQGLPLAVIAGHENAPGGTYGGDVLIATTDLLEAEGSTVSAFLIAYLEGLRDMAATDAGASFAPHDGGFGDRSIEGGTGQLREYLAGVEGEEPDLDALIDQEVLQFAQAWWGLPANPVPGATAPSEEGA